MVAIGNRLAVRPGSSLWFPAPEGEKLALGQALLSFFLATLHSPLHEQLYPPR